MSLFKTWWKPHSRTAPSLKVALFEKVETWAFQCPCVSISSFITCAVHVNVYYVRVVNSSDKPLIIPGEKLPFPCFKWVPCKVPCSGRKGDYTTRQNWFSVAPFRWAFRLTWYHREGENNVACRICFHFVASLLRNYTHHTEFAQGPYLQYNDTSSRVHGVVNSFNPTWRKWDKERVTDINMKTWWLWN